MITLLVFVSSVLELANFQNFQKGRIVTLNTLERLVAWMLKLKLVSFQMTSLNGRIVAMVTLERLVSKVITNMGSSTTISKETNSD